MRRQASRSLVSGPSLPPRVPVFFLARPGPGGMSARPVASGRIRVFQAGGAVGWLWRVGASSGSLSVWSRSWSDSGPRVTAGAQTGAGAQLSLVREGDLIAIGGVLPDEAARAALADAIRAAAGDIATIDMTEIRADAPASFREAGIWAASVVARMKPGAVLVEGQALTVEGQPDGAAGSGGGPGGPRRTAGRFHHPTPGRGGPTRLPLRADTHPQR